MYKKLPAYSAMICLPLMFVGNTRADPSATSICDMPQYRGTAIYNKYCGAKSGENSSYDYEAAQRAQAAAEAAAAQRQRDAEFEQQRIEEENRRRMEEIANQAKFLDDRDAAASTLRGASGSTISGGGSGLRGSSAAPELRGSMPDTPQELRLESTVVDARNVPSGLPKSIDDAIATGYSGAPAGVSDRVRKGFQAVMTHDWKLAKAWFEDALNHDPGNMGLKHLIELSDYTQKHVPLNDAAKSGRPSARRAAMQLPTDTDMEFLFPGWVPPPAKPSSARSGKPLELPEDSDIEYLFPGLRTTEARQLNDYLLQMAIRMTENDPALIRLSNPAKGKPAKTSTK